MKIECTTNKLKNAVILVDRVTGKNLTLPVLSYILFTLKNKELNLRSTNLSIGMDIKIPVKSEGEGVFAIKGDVLSNILSNITNDPILKIEKNENTISITVNKNRSVLKTIPHEDFPTLPTVDGYEFQIQTKKFLEGLKAVFYSASVSDIKPEIGSVYIYPEGDLLVFVATDSFRLAEKKIKIKKHLDFPGVLIPYKNTLEIMKILESIQTDEITITINKNQISFKGGEVYTTSRLVDSSFPDYKQIIPKEHTTNIIVLKQDLINSLKISNVFSDKFNQITFNINPNKKVFEIDAKNTDLGESKTQIESTLKGEPIEANFNYKYITDCFQSINSDSVSLDFFTNTKPLVVRPIGDDTFMYLVMPMHR